VTDMENEVRELLADVSNDIPPQRQVPPELRGRARRRIMAVGATALTVTAVLVVGGLATVRSLSEPPVPIQPSPKPTPSATASPTGGPPSAAALQPLWPQTTMDGVRQAQELADAGDPRYTWQTDKDLADFQLAQHHPAEAQIFPRFLREKLGWENFLWTEAFAHPDGLEDGEVVYIRCAPGGTNPLYPPNDDDPPCAPTLDELHYETVRIRVAQLGRQGPRGIWVVTGWKMAEPGAEADPRVVEADATAILDDFLQARIDGAGAEDLAGFPEFDEFADQHVGQGIPLLYATSTGAPYERAEHEVVAGPSWPGGEVQFKVRLFAENDATVVEQFYSVEFDEAGRVRLVYDYQGGDEGSGPGTTENGNAVPEGYSFLGGDMTYRAAFPVAPYSGGIWDQTEDVATIANAHERRLMMFLADPRPIEPGCDVAPAPATAAALAESLQSDPDLVATAPVPMTIGGIPALQMDVRLAGGANSCPWQTENMSATTPLIFDHAPLMVDPPVNGPGTDRTRLYLVDLPGGSARVLAIAIISDEDSIQRMLNLTAPIVDSIEFHSGPNGQKRNS